MEFAAGSNTMSVAGIGQVSTLPDYRGRGLMTVLMKAAETEIDRRNFVLGYLGGDRFRYAWNGFETTVYGWRFELGAKDLKRLHLSGWSFHEPESLEPWMHETIEAKPYRRILSFDEAMWSVERISGRLMAAEGPAGRAVVAYEMSQGFSPARIGGRAQAPQCDDPRLGVVRLGA